MSINTCSTTTDFPRSKIAANKRSFHNAQTKKDTKKPKVVESIEAPHILSFNDFSCHSNCIAVVHEVAYQKVFFSLPHNQIGVARLQNLSQIELDQQIMTGLFAVGDYVVVSCCTPVQTELRSRTIELSLLPQSINAFRGHPKEGEVIIGCVISTVDDNYIVDVGMGDRVKVFIKSRDSKKFKNDGMGKPRELCIGDQVIGCVKATVSSRSFELIPHNNIKVQSNSTFNNISPGSLVTASTIKAFTSGLVLELSSGVRGFLCRQNFDDYFADEASQTKDEYSSFVVLYVNQPNKQLYLTVMRQHYSLKSNMKNTIIIRKGLILQSRIVDVGMSKAVLECTLPEYPVPMLAFCMKKYAVDEDSGEFAKVLVVGSQIRCRVIQHNLLENYLTVATKMSIVDEKYFCFMDLSIGQHVEGTITSSDEGGLNIRLSGFVSGRVPFNHINDKPNSDVDLTPYRNGRKVVARVLNLPPNCPHLLLTMKLSFVQYRRKSVFKFNDELCTKSIPAVVRSNVDGGWQITSFGTIEGHIKRTSEYTNLVAGMGIIAKPTGKIAINGLPSFNVVKVFGEIAESNLKVGQIIDCVVTEVNERSGILKLDSAENSDLCLKQSELSDFPDHIKLLFSCYKPETKITCLVVAIDKTGCQLTARKSFISWAKIMHSLPTDISDICEGDVALGVIRNIGQNGINIALSPSIMGFVHRSFLDIPASSDPLNWIQHFRLGQTVCVAINSIETESNFFNGTLRYKNVSSFNRSVLSADEYIEHYIAERKFIVEHLCGASDNIKPPELVDLSLATNTNLNYLLTSGGQFAKLGNGCHIAGTGITSVTRAQCYLLNRDFDYNESTNQIHPFYTCITTNSTVPTVRFERYKIIYKYKTNELTFKSLHKSLNAFYHVIKENGVSAVRCDVLRTIRVNDAVSLLHVAVSDQSDSRTEFQMLMPSKFKDKCVDAVLWPRYKYSQPYYLSSLVTADLIGLKCVAICYKLKSKKLAKKNSPAYIAFTSYGLCARLRPLQYIEAPELGRPVDAWTIAINNNNVDLCLYDYRSPECKLPAQITEHIVGEGVYVRIGPTANNLKSTKRFLPLTEMMDCYSKPSKSFDEGGRLKVVELNTGNTGKSLVSCRPSRLGSEWKVKDQPINTSTIFVKGQHCRGFVSIVTRDFIKIALGIDTYGYVRTKKEDNSVVDFDKLVQQEEVINCFVQSWTFDESKSELSVDVDIDLPMLILYRSIHEAGFLYGHLNDEIARSLFEDKSLRLNVQAEINKKRKMLKGNKPKRRRSNFEMIEFKNDIFPDPADIDITFNAEDVRDHALAYKADNDDRISWDGEDNFVFEEKSEYINLPDVPLIASLPQNELKSTIDYERLIALDSNNSLHWIQYIAFELQQANIDAARSLAEKALSTIDTRQEQHRWNLWVAYLNMESLHGTENSLSKLISRATVEHDERKVLTVISRICLESGKHKECELILQRICKLYPKEVESWLSIIKLQYEIGDIEKARHTMNTALDTLSIISHHVDIICKSAQFEFHHGSTEKSQAMFEKLITTYPKRTDIWNVYASCFIKANRIPEARVIFHRVANLSNISRKRLIPVYKQFIDFEKKYGDANSLMNAEEITLVE
ncbi:hypothetical protein GJ496_009156 [Pomphorhynchus laevis]|nr:hypothetical protein GJ496_009156 [Pomphorhynchus laevis]